jgi:ParB/RepB/Spo0J family partition protein
MATTSKRVDPQPKASARKVSQRPAIEPRETLDLDPKIILKNPWQPRRDFDPEKLAELGADMLANGQAQAIAVQSIPGGCFQLMAGERRLRAALAVGMAPIRAAVFDCDNAEARRFTLCENLHRADLNKIEEAAGFQLLLDNGDFSGPGELAATIHKSQGYVSNTLRLLAAPTFWKDRIISREITERHVRAVLPYVGHDEIMAVLQRYVAGALAGGLHGASEIPTVEEWETNVVPDTLAEYTRPIDGQVWDERRGRHVPIFEIAERDHAALGVVQVGGELRAANVELWEQLQAAYMAQLDAAAVRAATATFSRAAAEEREEMRGEVPTAAGDRAGGEAADDGDVKTTKATKSTQRPQQPITGGHETAVKDFPARLWGWKSMFLRHAIADEVRERASLAELVKLLLYSGWETITEDEMAAECARATHGRKPKNGVAALLALDEIDTEKVASRLLAARFWSDRDGPILDVDANHLPALAAALEIDLAEAWAAGDVPAPQGYWDLHSKEQLLALAQEVKLSSFVQGMPYVTLTRMTKPQLVSTLMGAMSKPEAKDVGIPMPKEIAKAQPPKKA